MRVEDIAAKIKPFDKAAYLECIKSFDSVAKPVGSLGALEEIVAKIAGITGNALIPAPLRKAVVVFCADNGVVAQGVSQSGSEVTTAIARSLAAGRTSVSRMAKTCGAEVFPVDIGMLEDVAGLENKKLSRGTGDITKEPAMSRETAEKAVLAGVEYIRTLKEKGFTVIATGEVGIGNTTTSSAVTAALLGKTADEVTGRGAGLDDMRLALKIDAVRRAIDLHMPDAGDPVGVLAKLGGLDIAAMAGAFLGGAIYRTPVVMDGFISAAAALCAVRICPRVREFILPSHMSAEPGMLALVKELDFSPVIHAGMHLGEGTGAVTLFPLLDMAADVLNNAAKFTDIAVAQYERLT